MDFHSSHPLDNITRNNPYSMLEALIPFVDYPMKLPLALLVKYYEVRLILNAFQSNDTLSRYGLHNTSNDPMEMLGNIMGISPEMLKTLMSLMESQNTSNVYADPSNQNTSGAYDDPDGQNASSTYNNPGNQKYQGFNTKDTSYTHKTPDDISYQNQSNNGFNNHVRPSSFDTTDNLDDNIKNIFAEYDMLQAAEYSEEDQFSCDQPAPDIEYQAYDKNNENSQKTTEPEYYI